MAASFSKALDSQETPQVFQHVTPDSPLPSPAFSQVEAGLGYWGRSKATPKRVIGRTPGALWSSWVHSLPVDLLLFPVDSVEFPVYRLCSCRDAGRSRDVARVFVVPCCQKETSEITGILDVSRNLDAFPTLSTHPAVRFRITAGLAS